MLKEKLRKKKEKEADYLRADSPLKVILCHPLCKVEYACRAQFNFSLKRPFQRCISKILRAVLRRDR